MVGIDKLANVDATNMKARVWEEHNVSVCRLSSLEAYNQGERWYP